MTVQNTSLTSSKHPQASSKKPKTYDSGFYHLYFEPVWTKEPVMDPRSGIITNEPHRSRDFYRIVIVGDYAVGKPSMVSRFCEDFFRDSHATTVGIDFKVRTITLPNDKRKVKLELFDTAGLDKFRTVASNYYQNAAGKKSLKTERGHKESLSYERVQ